jgi:hypothetical protein
MNARNCWEYKNCGREPGGLKTRELGVCPAAIERKVNGINKGKNGGRACWVVTGTLCGGRVQGSFATKLGNCMECDFYKLVATEQGKDYSKAKEILTILN